MMMVDPFPALDIQNLAEALKKFVSLPPDAKIMGTTYLKNPHKLTETRSRGEVEEIAFTTYKGIRALLDRGYSPEDITREVLKSANIDPSIVMLSIQNVQSTLEEIPSAQADLRILGSISDENLVKLIDALIGGLLKGRYKTFSDLVLKTGLNEPISHCEAVNRLMLNSFDDMAKGNLSSEKLLEQFVVSGVHKEKASIFVKAIERNVIDFRQTYVYKMLRSTSISIDEINEKLGEISMTLRQTLLMLKSYISRIV